MSYRVAPSTFTAASRVVTQQPQSHPQPPVTRTPVPASGFLAAPLPPKKQLAVQGINQRDPNGDGRTDDYAYTTPKYANGDGFCAPTTMLMAAEFLGYDVTGNTAQTIVDLAQTGHYQSGIGVEPQYFDEMAAELGMQVTERSGSSGANALVKKNPDGTWSADHAWLQREIAAGHPVIYNVDLNGRANPGGGHYRMLVGYDNTASPKTYTVMDPWTGQTTTVAQTTVSEQIIGGNQHAFAVSEAP